MALLPLTRAWASLRLYQPQTRGRFFLQGGWASPQLDPLMALWVSAGLQQLSFRARQTPFLATISNMCPGQSWTR